MHEETNGVSVPSSVAASTNQNGTTAAATVAATAAPDLEMDVPQENDNPADLDVTFTSNSGGK